MTSNFGPLGKELVGETVYEVGSEPQPSTQRRATPPEVTTPYDKTSTDEDQVRLRYARSLADMRSLATALEGYRIDYNAYPETLAPHLTTPISYIMRVPADPFGGEKPSVIRYLKHDAGSKSLWTLWSLGPDANDDEGRVLYDPTNGILSVGDVIRKQQ